MQNRLRPQFLGVAHALPHVPLVCVKRTGCGTDLYYHDTSATASLPPSFIHASSKNTQQLDKTHVSLTPVPHPQTCYITPLWCTTKRTHCYTAKGQQDKVLVAILCVLLVVRPDSPNAIGLHVVNKTGDKSALAANIVDKARPQPSWLC